MAYSIINLQSIAECDELLAIVSRERRGMENRKESLQIRTENMQESSTDYEADLASMTSELNHLNNSIPTMPEGAKKESMITDQIILTGRIRLLNQRRSNFGTMGILQRELDIELLERGIEAYNEFISDLNTHKATL
jgi:hypothetical protein